MPWLGDTDTSTASDATQVTLESIARGFGLDDQTTTEIASQVRTKIPTESNAQRSLMWDACAFRSGTKTLWTILKPNQKHVFDMFNESFDRDMPEYRDLASAFTADFRNISEPEQNYIFRLVNQYFDREMPGYRHLASAIPPDLQSFLWSMAPLQYGTEMYLEPEASNINVGLSDFGVNQFMPDSGVDDWINLSGEGTMYSVESQGADGLHASVNEWADGSGSKRE